MRLIWKRRATFFSVCLSFLSGGIEYAVIFPTVWLYLQERFNASATWLGVVIGAFSFAGLIFGPVLGRLADKTQRSRPILIVGILFLIGGSFMYSLDISPAFLMLSRFIAGIGGASGGATMANVTWCTTHKERTFWITIFMMCRMVGLIVGPVFNLGLQKIHFYIGPYLIDGLSAPGIFMACFNCVLLLVTVICYYDLHHPPDDDNNAGNDEQVPTTNDNDNDAPNDLIDREKQGWRQVLQELNRYEIVALLFVAFVYMFNQGALETALTPLTKVLYNFGEIDNSWVYLFCGAFVLCMFIVIAILTRYLSDRVLFLTGIFSVLASLTWYTAFVPRFKPGDRSTMPLLAVGACLDLGGIPLVAASSLSLLTKLVSRENQGFVQGIRRAVNNIALTVGPLWAGGAVLNHLYLFFGSMVALYVIAAGLMVDSWKRLVPQTSL